MFTTDKLMGYIKYIFAPVVRRLHTLIIIISLTALFGLTNTQNNGKVQGAEDQREL